MADDAILIVDDNVDTNKLLVSLLKRLGRRAICVSSGEEALAYLRLHLPRLIVLDVMLPGMDGIEVLRALRADPRTARLPVSIFSAVSDPAYREHAIKHGADDYWVKSTLDFEQISAAMKRLAPDVDEGGLYTDQPAQ
jgi:CheY-like chemotaxis protein